MDKEKKRKVEEGSMSESMSENEEILDQVNELEGRLADLEEGLDSKLNAWSEKINNNVSSVVASVLSSVFGGLGIKEPEELGKTVKIAYDREIENKSRLNRLEERVKKIEQSFEKFEGELMTKLEELGNKIKESVINCVSELVRKEINSKESTDLSNVWLNRSVLNKEKVGDGKDRMRETQLAVLDGAAEEVKERERRKRNFIIFGLNKSDKTEAEERHKDDKKNVEGIMNYLKLNDVEIEKIIRFRDKKNSIEDEKIPPVLVILKNENDRKRVLSVSKELKKSNSFKKVFISADQTLAERSSYQALRLERDTKQAEEMDKGFFWAIRGKDVVRIKKNEEGSIREISDNLRQ